MNGVSGFGGEVGGREVGGISRGEGWWERVGSQAARCVEVE